MHRSRCIAEGGFKIINGPPRVGKGPMNHGDSLGMRDEASLPKPTQAGRIETCTELISKAMKCLENNDKRCVMKKIKELIKADCHNGYAVGKEIADRVRGVVHELWLVSDNECRCELLRMLKDLNVMKGWVRDALGMFTKMLNKWLRRCGFSWEGRTTRNNVIKEIEDLLRERFGWSEVRMCEELWRFVGVDVNEFRRYGVEPCIWLEGLEKLSNLRNPYWLGLGASDLAIGKYDWGLKLELSTTNTIDAIFFAKILSAIKAPSLEIEWKKVLVGKYISKSIALSYYVILNVNAWPWPIGLDINELEEIIKGFTNEGLAEFIAAKLDGDGRVWYNYTSVFVGFTACKDCPKSFILNVLKEVITKRFGIIGDIKSDKTADELVFRGKSAVRLLRLIRPFVHHPLRRLRIELILAYYDGKISKDEFMKLYEQTKYELGAPDVKRNNALEILTRAAPQTHTHGAIKNRNMGDD
jgi:hypothetical protein